MQKSIQPKNGVPDWTIFDFLCISTKMLLASKRLFWTSKKKVWYLRSLKQICSYNCWNLTVSIFYKTNFCEYISSIFSWSKYVSYNLRSHIMHLTTLQSFFMWSNFFSLISRTFSLNSCIFYLLKIVYSLKSLNDIDSKIIFLRLLLLLFCPVFSAEILYETWFKRSFFELI